MTNTKKDIMLSKIGVFYTYFLPAVPCGFECVNVISKSLKKLVVFQNHMMRCFTSKRLSAKMECLNGEEAEESNENVGTTISAIGLDET